MLARTPCRRVARSRPRRPARLTLAVAVLAAASASLSAPAHAADRIYWANEVGSKAISFTRLDNTGGGGDLSTAGATFATPEGIALDPPTGRIYWGNFGNDTISFAKLDNTGGGGQLPTATAQAPAGVAIDPVGRKIYWANDNGTKISFVKFDGTGPGDLNTTGATVMRPLGVALDLAHGRIYWANNQGTANHAVSFARLDNTGGGGDLKTGTATVDGPYGVALDLAAGRAYWANNNPLPGKISFAKLDNTGGRDLSTGTANVDGPEGVAIDHLAGKIYWVNTSGEKISFARLNETGGGDLDTTNATVSNPDFPLLREVPRGLTPPVVTGGSEPGSKLSCSLGAWGADQIEAFLYRAPKSFAFQWTRNGADIPGVTGSSFTPNTPGVYRCRVTATNSAGSASQTSGAPPSVKIVTPAAGAHYKQGQKVLANYSCTDPDGPADVVLCAGPAAKGKPIDTSTAGPQSFTVQAADRAGDTSSKTVHYTVDTTEASPPAVHGLPPDEGCVPGKLKLKVSVHPTRLRRAAVFLDGKLVASSTKHDFKVTISGSQLSSGRHTIKILREYKSGTKRRSTFSFTRCKKGGKSPHIHTEGTPDRGSCTAKPFSMFVSITRAAVKTIRVTLDGKRFVKPGRVKFTLRIDVSKLRAGHHRLIIKASDKFKNGSVSITDFVRCA